MKKNRQGVFFLALAISSLIVSCSKPDITGGDNPGDSTDMDQKDTTEKVDTTTPMDPVAPKGTFTVNSSFGSGNSPDTGWRTAWRYVIS